MNALQILAHRYGDQPFPIDAIYGAMRKREPSITGADCLQRVKRLVGRGKIEPVEDDAIGPFSYQFTAQGLAVVRDPSAALRASCYQAAIYAAVGDEKLTITRAAAIILASREADVGSATHDDWAVAKVWRYVAKGTMISTGEVDGEHIVKLSKPIIKAIKAGRIEK